MGKKSDQPLDQNNQSHTEIHVETNSAQTASSGATPPPAPEVTASEPVAASQPSPASAPAPAGDQIAELTADLQRLQAEFANFRRRAEAERAEVLDFAKNRVVREFLTVRDSFDAEQSHRPAGADPAWACCTNLGYRVYRGQGPELQRAEVKWLTRNYCHDNVVCEIKLLKPSTTLENFSLWGRPLIWGRRVVRLDPRDFVFEQSDEVMVTRPKNG